MVKCSKCDEQATHHITVRDTHPEPAPGAKDTRALRNIRFCDKHWGEVLELLPAA